MTSSMLAGERRWASTRKGSMKVLGKVVVPKPFNLPSQRLENHGLDPNVEIVPKGTLSWGSRSSSSASNAWGSSTLSPNAESGAGSPSQLSGHLSSGGSGTRPSTAGSDITHEPNISAWGPNSRPSSASGALTSSQTSLTLSRPRSAETRPGSSQLSRFAGSSSDSSAAWGSSGTVEKLGVASSKNDGFSLTSGDFPTLGSERENSGRTSESPDHGSYARPGSSSSRIAPAEERSVTSPVVDVPPNTNDKSGTVNTWKRDSSQYVEDGVRPCLGKWQGDQQPYINANVPPQHFDTWHGPPMNAPTGVWYRGPPGGPPYGTPVGPGHFPMEPFPFYRPQIPATALANSQPVPLPGAGPRGPHQKNADMYRPHIPDAYIRPGMPIRPGFYPAPVAYESYYGPPMGYCNSSERDIPFMGTEASPSVYNRYPNQNTPDASNSHVRAGGHGSTGKTVVSKQVEPGHRDDSREPYKVLQKQPNDMDGKQEDGKWEKAVPANAPYLEKVDQQRPSSWKNEWGADNGRDEGMCSRKAALSEDAPRASDNLGCHSLPTVEASVDNTKAVDVSLLRKTKNAASPLKEAPQVLTVTPRDSILIQKIEGLNAKARASDGRHDVASISNVEEQKTETQAVKAKVSCPVNAVVTQAGTHASGDPVPTSNEVEVSTVDKTLQPAPVSRTSTSRRGSLSMQSRVDRRGKRFYTQDNDGWRKKPLASEPASEISTANFEPPSNINIQERHKSVEVLENSGSNFQEKDEGESLAPIFDPSYSHAQRAKMREIAKQRAKQLQEEEEERTREQKLKALAKLEELNKRIQVADGSSQKLENGPRSGAIQQGQEVSQRFAQPVMDAGNYGKPVSASVSSPIVVNTPQETLDVTQPESVVSHGHSLTFQQGAHNAGADDRKPASQVNDSTASGLRGVGYKQKQNVPLEKNLTEKSIPVGVAEVPKIHADTAINNTKSTKGADEVDQSCESRLPIIPNVVAESSTHQRRKNNRSSKSKHKMEEEPITGLSSAAPKEMNLAKTSIGSEDTKVSEFESDPSTIQSLSEAKHAIQSSEQAEQRINLPSEEAHGRVNNTWKSPHSRRMPRNLQANRSVEKFHGSDAVIWAPVRSQSRSEVADDASQKIVADVASTAKSDNSVQNSQKSKRAEMERYVPKPVAKELAQQGSIQLPLSSSINQATPDEIVGKAESSVHGTVSSQPVSSVTGNVGSAVEFRSGDSKQNKQSKAHASWRQRTSTESPPVQGLQDGFSVTSNPGKNIQKSTDQHSSLVPGINSVKGQPNFSDEWNSSDGRNIHDNSDLTAPITSSVKDQGLAGRGKRHPFRGHRSTGNNYEDHRNTNSGESDKSYSQNSALEISQADRAVALKESRGVERTTSQWQPKSQAHPAHNQRAGSFAGVQNVSAELGEAIKNDSPPQDLEHLPPKHNKDKTEIKPEPYLEQSLSEPRSAGEAPNGGHQAAKRERKVTSFRGCHHSPNQVSTNIVEPATGASFDARHDQRFSSGFRRNGNQGNRSGRGHESRGDWIPNVLDNKQFNVPANRERQKHSSHYEYQPIGPYNNSKSGNFEGLTDSSQNGGSRYRERGQGMGHSRRGRGNLYGRQSGTIQVDEGYD